MFRFPNSSLMPSQLVISEKMMAKYGTKNEKEFSNLFDNVSVKVTTASSEIRVENRSAPRQESPFRIIEPLPRPPIKEAVHVKGRLRSPQNKKSPHKVEFQITVETRRRIMSNHIPYRQKEYFKAIEDYQREIRNYQQEPIDSPQVQRLHEPRTVVVAKSLDHTDKKPYNILKLQHEIQKHLPLQKIDISNKQSKVKEVKVKPTIIEDDRDRFGQYIYPLSIAPPAPGPGAYDSEPQSIMKRVQRLNARLMQKRLVRVWQSQI